jgi:thymidine phosphorylase
VGALAMAIVLNGMTSAERIALTGAMRDSGDVLDWSDAGLPGPGARQALDRRGGRQGEPAARPDRRRVRRRGADDLRPRARPHRAARSTSSSRSRATTRPRAGCVPRRGGERGRGDRGPDRTAAPADRRLYAIRDATGTVESIPLIVASILSKKLAAGLDALVMDVKVGSGAFLPDRERAEELARAIVEVATGNGLPTAALLTDMDRVLGRTAGNAVEVRESIDHLTGAASDERLREVTLALSAELLVLGRVEPTPSGRAGRPSGRSTPAPRPSGSARWWPSWAARAT